MNILITGAYGFVGTNLALALKDKHNIHALDIEEKEIGSYSCFFSWDKLKDIPWNDLEIVIHLAGKAHDTKNKSDAQVYFDVNTRLTQLIFDCFLQSKAQQFFFFSSVKAVADKVVGDFLTERVIPNPIGPYGESKIKAEEYIQSKNWNGKKVYIFRPCMIHGPGNKGNLNLLYNLVKKGIPYPLGSFDNKRSFLNIWNLIYILEQFIQIKPESGIYNLADDDPISTNELIKIISFSMGKKARIWKIDPLFIFIAAKLGTFFRLPINSNQLQKLIENYVVSNVKVKNAIKVSNLPIKVDEGFKLTVKHL